MKNYIIEKTVTEDMLAVNVGSGSLNVLATPVVVALMEEASAHLADTILEEGITTVGTMLEIQHISPTPLSGKIKVESVLAEQNNRVFRFDVRAYDNCGMIAQGSHTRMSVKSEKFQKKADEKIGEV